jgi:HEAT repeat protein
LAARGSETVGVTHAIASLASALDPATWPASRELQGRRIAVAREVATTLGTLPPTPAGEALLLQLLAHTDGGTRSAAVASLGAVGTVEAVPALQGVETTAGLLTSLGGAARTAVRAIQARSGGARGGVSLAATAAGDLALAQPERPEAGARAAQAQAARRNGA